MSGELPQRHKGERDRIYRRPAPQEDDSSSPVSGAGRPAGWFGGGERPPESFSAPGSPAGPPEFGPASPAGPGRASFGFSAGPISGNRPLGGRDDFGDRTPAGRDDFRDRTPAGREDFGDRTPAAAESGGMPIVRSNPAEAAPTSPAGGEWAEAPEAPARQPAGKETALSSWEGTTWADTLNVPRQAPAQSATPGSRAATPAARMAPLVRPRRSRVVTGGMAVLGVVAVLMIALTGVVFYSGPDSRINEILHLGTPAGSTNSRLVTAPINDRTTATFEMLAASDRVRLSVADIGEDLFRISTPEDSSMRPSPQLTDDAVRLQVTRDGAGVDGQVDVVLTARVRWTLRFSGYAAECDVDLGEGQVAGIEMVGGTRRALLDLSAATATVPVKITGGVEELTLRSPAGSPVRVKVGGGAATVTAGNRTLRNVAPGSTLTPKDWNTRGRYDVDAASKINLLSVEAG